jgi:hypothetical protein
MVVAASLRQLEYVPRFEPPLGGKLLDVIAEIDGSPVYFEVVAPERAEASAEDQRLVERLIAEVRHRVSHCRVEIEICDLLDAESIGAIAAAIETAKPFSWVDVNSLARIRRVNAGQNLIPIFDEENHQIVIGGERSTQGDSTSVIARWEPSDARAKRIFNNEYKHFSQAVPNVLVVNVSAVTSGMKLWPAEMARLLQPTRNRKVGAVVFFTQSAVGPPEAIRRRWMVLENPHAQFPIPERLLAGFESLDESSAYGRPRQERRIAKR